MNESLKRKLKKETSSTCLGPYLFIIKVTVKNWLFTNDFYLILISNSIG
jgi:hypothetical protein